MVELMLIEQEHARSRSHRLRDAAHTAADEDCNDAASQTWEDFREAEANTFKKFIEAMETEIITLV